MPYTAALSLTMQQLWRSLISLSTFCLYCRSDLSLVYAVLQLYSKRPNFNLLNRVVLECWRVKEKVDDDPVTVRLLFEPSGRPVDEQNYYLNEKDNVCVVCGADESYIRKNIIPREYRKSVSLTNCTALLRHPAICVTVKSANLAFLSIYCFFSQSVPEIVRISWG